VHLTPNTTVDGKTPQVQTPEKFGSGYVKHTYEAHRLGENKYLLTASNATESVAKSQQSHREHISLCEESATVTVTTRDRGCDRVPLTKNARYTPVPAHGCWECNPTDDPSDPTSCAAVCCQPPPPPTHLCGTWYVDHKCPPQIPTFRQDTMPSRCDSYLECATTCCECTHAPITCAAFEDKPGCKAFDLVTAASMDNSTCADVNDCNAK